MTFSAQMPASPRYARATAAKVGATLGTSVRPLRPSHWGEPAQSGLNTSILPRPWGL